MSAIDTFNNVHVAYINNLPIYWILTENKMSLLTELKEDELKIINQYNLSIGGGSGEHPALVFYNDQVVYNFLQHTIYYDNDNENNVQIKELKNMIKKINVQESDFLTTNSFNKNQWDLSSFIKLADFFKQHGIMDIENFESNLSNLMALLIINEMPIEDCIKNEDIKKCIYFIRENNDVNFYGLNESYVNKLSGFYSMKLIHKYGKTQKNGKTIWEYGLDDYMLDKENINNKKVKFK